jgi:hypothetical protein
MVLSKITDKISYAELKRIEKDDLHTEKNIYEIELNGEDVLIALGNAKNTFVNENIVFFPIYLIKSNNKAIQIGVYEILSSNFINDLNDDNDLDIGK